MFDKCFRDVLCIEFIDTTTHLKFAICVYYLPSENNVNERLLLIRNMSKVHIFMKR